jgi:hypothetical protein
LLSLIITVTLQILGFVFICRALWRGKISASRFLKMKGGKKLRTDSRGIKTGDIIKEYHISPSIPSTFLKDTQKIKKCTDFN